MSKYNRAIKATNGTTICSVDVYSVLEAFDVNNGAIQHAVKKLLAPSKRGHKSEVQDVKEAIESLNRALVMLEDINSSGVYIAKNMRDPESFIKGEWKPLTIKIDD